MRYILAMILSCSLFWGLEAQSVEVLDFSIIARLDGEFIDMGISSEGRIYVLQSENGAVVRIYSPDLSQCLSTINLSRLADRKIQKPMGIAVARDGTFWITDAGSGMLFHFDAVRLLDYIAWPDEGAISLKKPADISLTVDGNIVVTDAEEAEVVIMTDSGELLQHIPGEDASGLRFERAIDIAVDFVGRIYVVDGKDGGVCQFDPWGILRQRWGGAQETEFRLTSPQCVTSDASGLIYIADAAEGRCLVIDGTDVNALFGSPGTGDGQLQLPSDIAVTPTGDIALLDKGLKRVQIYSLPTIESIRTSRDGERFAPFSFSRQSFGSFGATRVSATNLFIATVQDGGKRVRVGALSSGPPEFGDLPIHSAGLKRISDIGFTESHRLYMVDHGEHMVAVADVADGGGIEPVACPYERWDKPMLLGTGLDEGVVIWDRGAKMLSFVGGAVVDRSIPVPVKFKGDIVGVLSFPSGDVFLVPSEGPVLRFGSGGPLPEDSTLVMENITAAEHMRGIILLASEHGGINGVSLAGEQYFSIGQGGGREPYTDMIVDITVVDSLVIFCDDEGWLGSYVLPDLGRAGIEGRLKAEHPSDFEFELSGSGIESQPKQIYSVETGLFFIGGLEAGQYTYTIRGKGWQTYYGDPIRLSPYRVVSLGEVSMIPGGSVMGSVKPSGISVDLELIGPENDTLRITTTEAGTYSVAELSPGLYTMKVLAQGFKPDSTLYRFSISAGQATAGPDINLIKLGTIRGVIKPMLDDIEIWVLNPDSLHGICRPEPLSSFIGDTEDSLGRYECRDMLPGVYKLIFRAPGYYPDTTMVPLVLREGASVRCGIVILQKAPDEAVSSTSLNELQQAVDEYGRAMFETASTRLLGLLQARSLPYSGISRASWLLGQCLMARGSEYQSKAIDRFRYTLVIDPYLTPGPEISPRVRDLFLSVRTSLFGTGGPPSNLAH